MITKVTKNLVRYIFFTLLVIFVIKYKDRIEFIKQFEGIEVELIGALVVFLLIDIPITINRVKKELDESKKAQVVIDYSLGPILSKLLLIFFEYLILPAKKEVKSIIEPRELDSALKSLRYDDFMSFYANYHREDSEAKFKDGSIIKTESIVFDNQLPKDSRYNLDTGYNIKKYNSELSLFFIDEKEVKQLSISNLSKELNEIVAELNSFLKENSSLLKLDHIAEIKKTIFRIQELRKSAKTYRLDYAYRVSGLLDDLLQLTKHYTRIRKFVSKGYLVGFGIDWNLHLHGLRVVPDEENTKIYKQSEIYL